MEASAATLTNPKKKERPAQAPGEERAGRPSFAVGGRACATAVRRRVRGAARRSGAAGDAPPACQPPRADGHRRGNILAVGHADAQSSHGRHLERVRGRGAAQPDRVMLFENSPPHPPRAQRRRTTRAGEMVQRAPHQSQPSVGAPRCA